MTKQRLAEGCVDRARLGLTVDGLVYDFVKASAIGIGSEGYGIMLQMLRVVCIVRRELILVKTYRRMITFEALKSA